MTPQSSSSTIESSRSGAAPVAWPVLQDALDRASLLQAVHAAGRDVSGMLVGQLSDDSRMIRGADVEEGAVACFIAVKGVSVDGHQFIEAAIENGASIVVCETVPEAALERHPEVVFAKVNDGRTALAELGAAFYGYPSRDLKMVGVTGTNGKTTVSYLVHHAIDALDVTTGLISTIEVRTGTVATNAALTTPGALELQRTLRRMVDDGCSACAMEVSSHALDQQRVHAIDYDIAIFTNLTSEHLDYHGTLSNYRAAKKKLFDSLAPDATAILNADDDAAPAVGASTQAEIHTYGTHADADVRFQVVDSRTSGLRLRFSVTNETLDPDQVHDFRLAGRFNAYNIAAAFAAVRALGYDADDILRVLREAPPVPGRFDQLTFDDGTTVVVDYAHTPDALENILTAVRETTDPNADLWCIFGCGGDRDASKRRVMGSLAETLADRVIVTSDNPRTEEPEAILNDIRRGMSRPAEAEWIVDRDEAIQFAAENAAPGDVVLIAGKGHETYQVIGTSRRAFDDREKARSYFQKRSSTDE
ncbi:UDP-N-acetylmuramoyl-L-alanyl-D-glutamate--2,6-diaminopimelate ligase [Longibacter salinarum]|uniref:UDP-N-acetylmuramoyl-L-alanyl-D-glutamate--2,6-diaminopimelate ligase n=1 Tax=Longibacter salinarum TaxID=1850348 RepID=A0A2A8CWZ0_9BACT|nr:UDP-N-acetylmuramoyl-L-alanyl-D-glutamate--2,6-diaminopimelate ligase [Longibacter salinarum]PEN13259.1 UDP-N-acetylmuramoyl-L-alanyl-D-glutamate--2,6-diaminopimelate ligase [Longibacter salinarum]